MASQHLLSVFLLLLSIAAASAAGHHARGRPSTLNPSMRNFVSSICLKTDYKAACMNSARFYGASYRVIDIDAMIEMHVRLASARLQEAKAWAVSIDSRAPPGEGKSVIQDCVSSYDDAAENLQAGLKSAKGGDRGTASSRLSSVFTFIAPCDAVKYPILKPLHKKNQIIQRLTSNSLAILSLKKQIIQ